MWVKWLLQYYGNISIPHVNKIAHDDEITQLAKKRRGRPLIYSRKSWWEGTIVHQSMQKFPVNSIVLAAGLYRRDCESNRSKPYLNIVSACVLIKQAWIFQWLNFWLVHIILAHHHPIDSISYAGSCLYSKPKKQNCYLLYSIFINASWMPALRVGFQPIYRASLF